MRTYPTSPVALLAAIALAFSACSSQETPSLTAPETTAPPAIAFADIGSDPIDAEILRISVPELRFVAPHAIDETNPIEVLLTDLLTDGLTRREPTGEIGPGLAETWSVSQDRRTWTFTLAERAFSTGEPIEAIDVVTSLNRVAARGAESLSGVNLAVVEGYADVVTGARPTMSGVAAIDERTVEIVLRQPYEPLPELLASTAFGVFPVEIDTTGPLPLSSSRAMRPVSLWESGFRVVNDVDGTAAIAGVEVWVDTDGRMIADGEVDIALGLSDADIPSTASVSWVTRAADAFFALNHAVAPFDDPDVRRAVLRAIDQEAIRDEFFSTAGLMHGFVPTEVPGGSVDACDSHCNYNRRRARRLVEETGAGDTPFTVDFFVDGATGSEQALAEYIVSALREVGLNATARGHAVEDYGALIAAGELDMFRFGSVSAALTADADLAAMFHSSGRDNVTNTSIAEFDALVEEAQRTVDVDARTYLYAQAERMLFSEAVVVPLVEFRQRIAYGPRIVSASLEADGSLDLDSIVWAGPEE